MACGAGATTLPGGEVGSVVAVVGRKKVGSGRRHDGTTTMYILLLPNLHFNKRYHDLLFNVNRNLTIFCVGDMTTGNGVYLGSTVMCMVHTILCLTNKAVLLLCTKHTYANHEYLHITALTQCKIVKL